LSNFYLKPSFFVAMFLFYVESESKGLQFLMKFIIIWCRIALY